MYPKPSKSTTKLDELAAQACLNENRDGYGDGDTVHMHTDRLELRQIFGKGGRSKTTESVPGADCASGHVQARAGELVASLTESETDWSSNASCSGVGSNPRRERDCMRVKYPETGPRSRSELDLINGDGGNIHDNEEEDCFDVEERVAAEREAEADNEDSEFEPMVRSRGMAYEKEMLSNEKEPTTSEHIAAIDGMRSPPADVDKVTHKRTEQHDLDDEEGDGRKPPRLTVNVYLNSAGDLVEVETTTPRLHACHILNSDQRSSSPSVVLTQPSCQGMCEIVSDRRPVVRLHLTPDWDRHPRIFEIQAVIQVDGSLMQGDINGIPGLLNHEQRGATPAAGFDVRGALRPRIRGASPSFGIFGSRWGFLLPYTAAGSSTRMVSLLAFSVLSGGALWWVVQRELRSIQRIRDTYCQVGTRMAGVMSWKSFILDAFAGGRDR